MIRQESQHICKICGKRVILNILVSEEKCCKKREGKKTMIRIDACCYEDSLIDSTNSDYPIVATSAGHFVLITKPHFETTRVGRADYQLLYVKNGHIEYYVNEQKYIAPMGSVIIYRPGQAQHYEYYLADNASIYWVHFSGSSVETILYSLGLNQICHKNCMDSKYEYYFEQLINEMLYRKSYYMDFCSTLIHSLLLAIARNLQAVASRKQPSLHIAEQVFEIINARYQYNINFATLARKLYISPSQLTKNFTKQYGCTPQRYLADLRIQKAKALLLSDIPIKEIAELTGFTDQMYFSRVFHKKLGLSPSEYRNQNYDSSLIAKEDNTIYVKRKM